jgi:hypothetical protein
MNVRLPFAPPTPAQQEHWREVRVTGRKNFIWKFGVIRYGGTMFIVMTALDLFRHQPFRRDLADYLFEIILGLLIWPLAGYCWGVLMWRFYEWHFSRTTGQQPTNQT